MTMKSELKDWIGITEAGFILKERYLKVRDLASQGHLGEVRRSDSGRYFVRKTSVEALKRKREREQQEKARKRT